MGAAPSTISNHERVSAVDLLGDDFPSGASFYLTSGVNDYTECLGVDFNGQSKTKVIKDSTDRKWLVDYAAGDRTKIALRNVGTGKWLALTNAAYRSTTFLYTAPVYWYAYKGTEPNTFWLSTTQSVDCFLCPWDNVPGPGKDVVNLTNRNGEGSGKGPELFEKASPWLSWRLEWTPEYERSKEKTPEGKAAMEKRKAQVSQSKGGTPGVCCSVCDDSCRMCQEASAEVEQFKGQYGDCKAAQVELNEQKATLDKAEADLRTSQAALNSQVKAHLEKEADSQTRSDTLSEREKALAAKEDALKQQEIDMQKRDSDLDARQQAIITDEKKSKATRVDKETARKQREEQAAHTREVQRKNEEARQERQAEQAESARLKKANAELQEKLGRLEADAAKHSPQGRANGDAAASSADFKKVKLQADLEHAREMIAELQQRSSLAPPQGQSQTRAQTVAWAPPPGFSTKPPTNNMPAYSIKPPTNKMLAYSIKPPTNKMPASSTALKVEAPKHTLHVSTAPRTSKMPAFLTALKVEGPRNMLPVKLAGPPKFLPVQKDGPTGRQLDSA